MEWILERLPVIIFILVFVGQLVRGLLRARDARKEPPPRSDALEEERRAREIQAEIRRKIAERRASHGGGEPAPAAPARQEAPAPPVMRRDPTAIPDPFGGPLKRMFEELERRTHTEPVPEPPPLMVERRNAELERQERLAEEMRALEEARHVAQRRAAQIAAAKAAEARTVQALRHAARGRLMDDLHHPESLRRAVVLREVLGPPVGLR